MTPNEATTLFRSLISLCGLSQSEVADLLGFRHDSVRAKASGRRHVTEQDLAILRDLWLRIDRGDTDLEGRSAEQAKAIQWARGVSKKDTSGDHE
ncbi:hypothetical protein [Aurantimonas coralicida]|uniref:hypothetical protein n=1 Tax=Aurantimonas coralicida TaxID=182270 RepID=UPI001D18C86D|nr:hypothetical protein [Aurantimonas coralicida]MCC4296641.1 hypothetical protein [Aurantimonas coralicida]